MPSSPTSESLRLRRSLTDPWALGLVGLTGLAAILFGHSAGTVILAAGLVLAVRVVAEYTVPRAPAVVAADEAAVQAASVEAALERATAAAAGRVPVEISETVGSIRRVVGDILQRETRAPSGSPQLFTVLRTATDYLPAALDAYLRLPSDYAVNRRSAEGSTAAEILKGQLDLLLTEMVEVADAVSKNDLDRLLAHGKFLADRFGHSELSFQEEGPR
jgi:hypothetical protein